jgi:hypothetical protein
MILAQSPKFTPASADQLLPIIREYFETAWVLQDLYRLLARSLRKIANRGSSVLATMTRRKKQPRHAGKKSSIRTPTDDGPALRIPSIPIAEVLSLIKETRGAVTWTAQEMIDTLKISRQDAEQVISILQLQGYVKPALESQGWLTTLNGEAVSGSKPPRFTPEKVDEALAALQKRITAKNQDRKSEFRISDAVAFGDFLSGRSRVQAADVGIRLVVRNGQAGEHNSTREEIAFLKQLRAKSALVQLHRYEAWMSHRSHRRLV